MNKISVEIYSHIYSFLEIKDLLPLDKYSAIILKSNLIWKPLLIKKFNIYKSINFYEEFKWQVRLKQNKEKYKQKWTLGCVGKIIALEKPLFKKSKNPYNI